VKLTQQQLEAHLMGAANILRGRTAGQDYKTYILSLMFFKRLSDQWDFEADDKIDQLERERGRPFTDAQRQALRSRGDLHRFTIPKDCHWSDVLKASENVGEVLTGAMRGVANANKELVGVDVFLDIPNGDMNAIGNSLQKVNGDGLELVVVSNRGMKVWPNGASETFCTDQWSARFQAPGGKGVTNQQIIALLGRVADAVFDFIKTEGLYDFDGKPGYTLGQGQ